MERDTQNLIGISIVKRQRSKKRKKKKSRRARKRKAIKSFRLNLKVHQLEIAKGHDGFLRGKPEPVIIAGLFRIAQHPKLSMRRCWHFDKPSSFPSTVSCGGETTISAPKKPSTLYLLLLIAIEEDDAVDVQKIYPMMEHPDDFSFWVNE